MNATSPFNQRDILIITTIINRSDYPHDVNPEDFQGLMIIDGIVEIKLNSGYARFNQDQFKNLVAKVKTEFPETPEDKNDRLSKEFYQACDEYQVSHGQIDWVSFGSKIYQGNNPLGYIGYGIMGWYSRQRDRGSNTYYETADDAVKSLAEVKVAV